MWQRNVALGMACMAVLAAGATGCSDELKLPGCVRALIASCAPQGACVAAETETAFAVCFDSGVRATSAKVDDPMACNLGIQVVTVANADGSPCYSVESYIAQSLGCEGAHYIWKDASGQVVATADRDWEANTTITCAATNEATRCKGQSGLGGGDPCCGITSLGTPVCDYPDRNSCTAGTCPAAK